MKWEWLKQEWVGLKGKWVGLKGEVGSERKCVISTSLNSVGGDSAVKLLSKFGLLEAAVDYATDNL